MARIQIRDLAVDEALDQKALGLIRGGSGQKPLLASPSVRARLDQALGKRTPPATPGAPPAR